MITINRTLSHWILFFHTHKYLYQWSLITQFSEQNVSLWAKTLENWFWLLINQWTIAALLYVKVITALPQVCEAAPAIIFRIFCFIYPWMSLPDYFIFNFISWLSKPLLQGWFCPGLMQIFKKRPSCAHIHSSTAYPNIFTHHRNLLLWNFLWLDQQMPLLCCLEIYRERGEKINALKRNW